MRRITAQSLQNSALYYLKRYSASATQLKRVLLRKAARVNRERKETVEAAPLIDALVLKLVGLGYLDDARLAQQQAQSMRRGGRSAKMIRHKLQLKGLGAQVQQVAQPNADEATVWVLAKKKKLGPFSAPAVRKERRDKHLAALARAGYSFALAKKVIDAKELPEDFGPPLD
jgi:regulatory protein